MLRVLFVSVCAAVLCLGFASRDAHSDPGGPTGLHAFLLRADETPATTFSRTPSFAWNPVPGATQYQFQLALSDEFRDNAVVYANANVPSPVVAPHITLPWISGNPHSLYARVRAVTDAGVGAWSNAWGFDMAPPAPPTPLPSYPGVLRWAPVEGIDRYEVWLVDANKVEIVNTNVLDEREFYTFHQVPAWMGSIRWRIRVLRPDISEGSNSRLNGIQAASWGAWSQTYVSTNPAMTGGPIKLLGTVSDVYSDGSPTSPAHRLTPAFMWTGNTTIAGKTTELYRVEVFTDKQCLNPVFIGSVTGAPAFAPRIFGGLTLPTSAAGVQLARTGYLIDGTEPHGVGLDGNDIATSEAASPATPTTAAPGDPGGGSSTGTGSGGGASGSSGSSGSATGGGTLSVSGNLGAPVDLWDTEWPSSGYYWTVIPVAAQVPGALTTSVAPPGSKINDTVLPVTSTKGFNVGDTVTIGAGGNQESSVVVAISDTSLTLSDKLAFGHGAGETVQRANGSLQYQDMELPQDACASGRIARFGRASEPSLAAAGDLFASGLSKTGKLVSADATTQFYGQPIISWTPALGATAYEVQWSKTKAPFTPEAIPGGGNKGYVTASTSLVLPVGTGTWYYRVRGYDYNLPSGAQQMSWSDIAQIVVSPASFSVTQVKKSTFTVVGSKAAKKTAKKKTKK